MSEIKVSVVVPIYNMEKYIVQCITSIMQQSLKEIEIICVDDGSTDDSLKILTELQKEDSRIKIISQDNLGVSVARNVGVNVAQGQYLSILDADDFFDINMLEKAYNRSYELNADICIFRAKSYDDVNKKESLIKWCFRDYWIPNKECFSGIDVSDRLFNLGALWAWDKLFKRDFIISNNISFQNQRTANDAKFVCIALAMANKICICDDAYAIHREGRNDSLSVTRSQSWDCFYNALLAVEQELMDRGKLSFLQALRNWVVDFSLWNFETINGDKKVEVYNLIKNKIINHFGILQFSEDYYLWPIKYKKIKAISELPYKDYIYWCHKNTGDIILEVDEYRDNNIIMYGCGKIFHRIKKDFDIAYVCDKKIEDGEYEGFKTIDFSQIEFIEKVIVIVCIYDDVIAKELLLHFDKKNIKSIIYKDVRL